MKHVLRHMAHVILLSILLSISYFPICGQVTYATGNKYLWIDGISNFQTFSYADSIRYYVDKAASAGFTDLIIEVKSVAGEVMYPGSIAREMSECRGIIRPEGYDYLGLFIEAAHQQGLKVHASLSVFSEGNVKYRKGRVFSGSNNWESTHLTSKGKLRPSEIKGKVVAEVSPGNPEVQDYELSILKEVAGKYPLDGIMLDRCYYEGLESDFSEAEIQRFANYSGYKVENIEKNILQWEKHDGSEEATIKPGVLYSKWLEWRAYTIQQFIQKANNVIKSINPGIEISLFNRSRYSKGYENGLAINSMNVEDSSFAGDNNSKGISKYSILPFVNRIFDCYFDYEVTPEDIRRYNDYVSERGTSGLSAKSETQCIEESVKLTRVTRNNEVNSAGVLMHRIYKDNYPQLEKAIEICFQNMSGVMLYIPERIAELNWDELKIILRKNNDKQGE